MSSKCKRCGRPLKNPVYIEIGYGKVCAAKMGLLDYAKVQKNEQEPFIPFNGDIICRRTEHGPEVNIPHRYVKHSPTGFEWGYAGSGPADLALNALAMYIGREKAEKNGLYQEFKHEFIETMPYEGGVIKREQVLAWLRKKGYNLTAETN
ncbi:DUF6166 domain-containing protein [Anaerocellum danielii]|uniref:DUF6011 domain-containing protein n=1 Tax=Anaerocellum danielii TaxID=1387557 RepID=A0ABZ0TXM6_9FIRM|nr:DUF6166 domain-containing protein [Caldicellulosiruptor danielii]WPX08199.1 DUF6011 domain-containing protein [Caldicellulosiruptor danielii]